MWTPIRSDPPATAGQLGTIANCIGGDLVCAESLDGKRFAWLEIAWTFRGGDAMAHVWDGKRINLTRRFLRIIRGGQRCRFLGVRNK